MKVSELIASLEKVLQEDGDLDVVAFSEDNSWYSPTTKAEIIQVCPHYNWGEEGMFMHESQVRHSRVLSEERKEGLKLQLMKVCSIEWK